MANRCIIFTYSILFVYFLLGIERGVCDCGRCICKKEFFGRNCEERNCSLVRKDCMNSEGVGNQF